jgi:phosphomannomutase
MCNNNFNHRDQLDAIIYKTAIARYGKARGSQIFARYKHSVDRYRQRVDAQTQAPNSAKLRHLRYVATHGYGHAALVAREQLRELGVSDV